MIEINGELIEIDSDHGDDWLEDETISDSEKMAYFESLGLEPIKNLATEYGITSQEQYEEFLRNRANSPEPKTKN